MGICECAVVEINEAVVNLRRHRFIEATDDKLLEMRYLDSSAEWYDAIDFDSCLDNAVENGIIDDKESTKLFRKFENDRLVRLPEGLLITVSGEGPVKTEINQMVIEDDRIRWTCYPKRVEIQCMTQGLTYEEMGL